MKVQYENKVMSSALLFIDHYILKAGEAFDNHGSYFYPTDNLMNGYYTYASPFGQFVSDTSIPNATIPSGIYVDDALHYFNMGGQYPNSPLDSFDHSRGQVYLTSGIVGDNRVSGNYAVKEYSVHLTTETEQMVLFETKYAVKPRVAQNVTGLSPNQKTVPAIFLKYNGGSNEAFCLGGLDRTWTNIRAIVISDSAFSLDAVCNILKDTSHKNLPIIEPENLPFNALGALTGIAYNYENLATGEGPYIRDVYISKINEKVQGLGAVSPSLYSAFVDFKLETIRGTAL